MSAAWLQELIRSPAFAFFGSAASILSTLIAVVQVLRAFQRRTVSPELVEGEEAYLERLLVYLSDLHLRSSFDERYFVERSFRLKQEYQPRSFFIAHHESLLSRMKLSVGSPAAGPPSGYYTRDLASEAGKGSGVIVILGEPGSGKSVSARQLALAVARQSLRLRKPNRPIPVFLSLSEYTETRGGQPVDFYEFLRSVLSRRDSGSTLPSTHLLRRLDEYLEEGRLFFILDSLDEMPPEAFARRCQQIANFVARHGTNRFVLTCRSNDFAGQIKAREAYLDRLTPDEVRAFIRKRLPHTGAREAALPGWDEAGIYRRITAPGFILSAVVDNPFYLNLILYFFSIRGALPEDYPLLFRVVCEDWARREVQKELLREGVPPDGGEAQVRESTDVLLVSLSEIAFEISNSAGFGTYIELPRLESVFGARGAAGGPIRRALRLGVEGALLEANADSSSLRFIHHRFQEYFAAEFLNRALAEGRLDPATVASICQNIWWEEVTSILASIVESPTELIHALTERLDTRREDGGRVTSLERDYWLVGRCLRRLPQSEERAGLVSEIISRVEKDLESRHVVPRTKRQASLPRILDGLRALGEVDDPGCVDVLERQLRSGNRVIDNVAFSALASSPTGRERLAQRVHRIGADIYLRRRLGRWGGRYTESIRSIAFPGRSTQAILRLYALLGVVLHSYLPLFTLAVWLAVPGLRESIYATLVLGITVGFDILRIVVGAELRMIFMALELLMRSILLLSVGIVCAVGLFEPPYLAALSLFGIWLFYSLMQQMLLLTIAAVVATVAGREPKGLARALGLIGRKIRKSFRNRDEELQARLVSAGFITPERYIRTSMASPEDLQRVLQTLAEADFGGRELEVLEAVQNLERQFLQQTTTPRILEGGLAPPDSG